MLGELRVEKKFLISYFLKKLSKLFSGYMTADPGVI